MSFPVEETVAQRVSTICYWTLYVLNAGLCMLHWHPLGRLLCDIVLTIKCATGSTYLFLKLQPQLPTWLPSIFSVI